MAHTRAQATELLNKAEMQLFEDSRAPALRRFSRTQLAARVERARAARDRARDLLKRQRRAARDRGEAGGGGAAMRTARKEALLADVLQRFTEARRAAPVAASPKRAAASKAATGHVATKKVAKAAVAKKSVPGTVATERATAKKATARTAPAKAAPAKKSPSKKSPAKKTPAKKTAPAAPRRAAAGRRPTPDSALATTRRLLEAKHARDLTSQPWQSLDPATGHLPQPGFQSAEAADKAKQLHAGESRMASIHGSMSTRDRRNQGKRDHRGDTD